MPQTRSTLQKKAIDDVFSCVDRPLTVPEVHKAASDLCAGIGIATVYRAVSRLVSNGTLKDVKIPGQPTRYERVSLYHHHHFHCSICERVLDVTAPCESLDSQLAPGFKADRHELTFYGICADCNQTS